MLSSILLQLMNRSFWVKIFHKQRAGYRDQIDKLPVYSLLQSNTWKSKGYSKAENILQTSWAFLYPPI